MEKKYELTSKGQRFARLSSNEYIVLETQKRIDTSRASLDDILAVMQQISDDLEYQKRNEGWIRRDGKEWIEKE